MKKFILLLIIVSFAGCNSYTKIYVENDKVLKVKNVILNLKAKQNQRTEMSYYQSLRFQKQIDENNQVVYSLYDVLNVPSASYDIDKNRIYIIIDGEVQTFPTIFLKSLEQNIVREKKEDIMKADSSTVSVVTGYDISNRTIIKMEHQLSTELIGKIKNSKEIEFKYYFTPDYVNTEIKGEKLSNIKKWIDK